MKRLLIILGFVIPAFGQSSPGGRGWPLWQDYSSRFLGEDGRITDFQRAGATTSEGQAYALFFSLVADDRPRFQKILQWTG
jgi:endoglucanase